MATAVGPITIRTLTSEMSFQSPNKTNTLIINDKSSLHSGYSYLYEKKYFIFKKELPYEPLRGYKIFRLGEYSMKWLNENQVMISYLTKILL